jgi:hypothetical protein
MVAAAALVAGILIGFASGFSAGQRTGAPSIAGEVFEDGPAGAPMTSGQAFSEASVAEPGPVRVDSGIVVPPAAEPPAATAEAEAEVARPERVPEARVPNTLERAPRAPAVDAASAGPGALQILSRPSGAQVAIDGRVVGQTPLVVPDVAAGTHEVRIELPGFRRWATSVQVTPGARARVAASLEQ